MKVKLFLSTYGLKYPLTGMGWYIYHLTRGLEKHNTIKQLITIPTLRSHYDEAYKKNSFQSILKKLIQCYPGRYRFLQAYYNIIFSNKNRPFSFEKFIYHEPCYILRPYAGLKICSVHDLSHIYYPEYHPRARVKFLLRYLPSSIESADHIITGSNIIRDEIINYFKVPPAKITTIYYGVASAFKPRQLVKANKVLALYGLLGKTYILSVGTLEPRKNLERLIKAFNQLPEQHRKKYPLVLVGMKGWLTYKLTKLMNQFIRNDELVYLGYVSIKDLPYLYSGAYAFVYLSLYEGFGLPLLEALASGIPTLTSNISSMPEVVGNAALLTDPWDIDSIAGYLDRLLNDNFLRAKLKSKGPIQAAQFSWQKCVNQTVGIYQHVLNSCF